MLLDIKHTNEAMEGGGRLFSCTLTVFAHVMDGDADIQLVKPWGESHTNEVLIPEDQMLDIFANDNTQAILDGLQSELFLHTFQEMTRAESQ